NRKLDSHQRHSFQSADHVPTGIGMECGETSVIAYIYSLEKLGGFSGTDFSHYEPAGAHAETCFQKICNGYFLRLFNICLSAFQSDQIRDSLYLQLCVVFNSYDSFIIRDILRQCIQKGSFSGTGASPYQYGVSSCDCFLQKTRSLWCNTA